MADSLAGKYRPHDWNEVCSQNTIIKILSQQVATKSYKNAYLFSGASGCGKTTVARIFADKINRGCGSPIEIDAASHNSADSVREIISEAGQRAVDSEYKIYIIDECHAISTAGWQAFLKCIEEPPKYTIFIFCTTEVQKVPDTIRNRCQRYSFGRVKFDKIIERLTYICEQEHFTNYQEGIAYIAKLSEGGMRTAISFLDKCAGYSNEISINNVLMSLDKYQYDLFFRLIDLIFTGNVAGVIKAVEYFYNEGNDLRTFVDQFLNFVIDVNKYIIFGNCDITSIPNSMETKLRELGAYENSTKKLTYYMDKLLELKNMLKNDTSPKTTIEVVFIQMCRATKQED